MTLEDVFHISNYLNSTHKNGEISGKFIFELSGFTHERLQKDVYINLNDNLIGYVSNEKFEIIIGDFKFEFILK